MTTIKNISAVNKVASELLFKFQTGKINQDELYSEGVQLTLTFNAIEIDESNEAEALTAADLLFAIKHFATC